MKNFESFESFSRLLESVGAGDLYHATSYRAAASILDVQRFELSQVADDVAGSNNPVDNRFSEEQKFKYFLSMSREKYSGYALENKTFVTFVIDREKLRNKYHVKPYFYWGSASSRYNSSVSRETNQIRDEAEERAFSNSMYMLTNHGLVKETHVYVSSVLMKNLRYKQYFFDLYEAAIWWGYPIFIYNPRNLTAFQRLDKTHAVTNIAELKIAGLKIPKKILNAKANPGV